MLRHQPGDGALGQVDAELEELGMDSRGAPEWIRRDHSADQGFDLGADGRATAGGPGGELGPVLAEATSLPPQDGVRVTITRGRLHPVHTLASTTQKSRSVRRSGGRAMVRL